MALSRQILTGLLLLALVAQSFSKMIVVVDFYANQDYIARNLCINRLNTAIHCCGKCQLNKRLKQEHNKDNESPERKSDNGPTVISSRSFYLTGFVFTAGFTFSPWAIAREDAPVDRPHAFFHPPDC